MIRKTIFWVHLCVGIAASLVILMMSVTGVLLTYEHQIKSWSLSRTYAITPANEDAKKLPLEDIFAIADQHLVDNDIDRKAQGVMITNNETDPLSISLGRGSTLYANPYTGEILGDQKQGPYEFFSLMVRWHRWFDLSGDTRKTGRAITGAANLGFLFLIVSGLYLWLPKIWKWHRIRAVLFFNKKVLNDSQARDFNWHHVFGFWSAIPLIFIVATATVFNYSWASDLLKWMATEPEAELVVEQQPITTIATGAPLPLNELLLRAQQQLPEWKSIQISPPKDVGSPVQFTVYLGNTRQPQKRHNLTLNADTGEVLNWERFSDRPGASRWRSYVRYLHTGEVYGWFGQTIAGIVSLTSAVMVWTGLALAYRRLVQPLFRRRDEVIEVGEV